MLHPTAHPPPRKGSRGPPHSTSPLTSLPKKGAPQERRHQWPATLWPTTHLPPKKGSSGSGLPRSAPPLTSPPRKVAGVACHPPTVAAAMVLSHSPPQHHQSQGAPAPWVQSTLATPLGQRNPRKACIHAFPSRSRLPCSHHLSAGGGGMYTYHPDSASLALPCPQRGQGK